MFEKKLNIKFAPIKNSEFEFRGNDILVKPYLTISEKLSLLNRYVDQLFDKDGDLSMNYVLAEHGLIVGFIDTLTNLDVSEIDIDIVIANGLWNEIKRRIIGYDDVLKDLDRLIDMRKMHFNVENSLGKSIQKLAEGINNLSDLSPEFIQGITKDLSNSIDSLNQTVPGFLDAGKPAEEPQVKRKRRSKSV